MSKMPFLVLMLSISGFILSCDKKEPEKPDPNGTDTTAIEFAMGLDLSYINQVEDKGGVYLENGEVADPFELLAKHGTNTARLRLWHNPDWIFNIYGDSSPLYSGFDDVKKSIERAKAAGMDVLLDFHYSDTWADPGHQDIPAAWRNIRSIEVLEDSIYNYTYSILSKLHASDLLPEMVQIGNETNCGMMMTNVPAGFPSLNVCQGNWVNFGKIVNAAIKAVRAVDEAAGKETMVILHVADPKNLDYWLRDVIGKALVTDFETMGFSYYHIWHTTVSFQALPALVTQVKNAYNRDIMLLETAYPFTTANADNYPNLFYSQPPLTGFPYTVQGQRDFMVTLTQNMMDAGAIGVFYWEPAWISSNLIDLWGVGSSWENCAFFNFSGNITEVVEYFTWEYE